eukprot:1171409-Rhodomonas_salina.1
MVHPEIPGQYKKPQLEFQHNLYQECGFLVEFGCQCTVTKWLPFVGMQLFVMQAWLSVLWRGLWQPDSEARSVTGRGWRLSMAAA